MKTGNENIQSHNITDYKIKKPCQSKTTNNSSKSNSKNEKKENQLNSRRKRKNPRKLTRMLTPEKIFEEDELLLDKTGNYDKKKIMHIRGISKNTQISLKLFFEFLFYHILFYLFLGPFFKLLEYIFPSMGRKLSYNLQFLRCSFGFYNQFISWVLFLMVILGYSFFEFESLTPAMTYTVIMGVYLRSVNIAGKYANFCGCKISQVRNIPLSEDKINEDFLLGTWAKQFKFFHIVYESIQDTIEQNVIEESTFFLSFMKNEKSKTEKKLKLTQELLEKYKFEKKNKDNLEISKIQTLKENKKELGVEERELKDIKKKSEGSSKNILNINPRIQHLLKLPDQAPPDPSLFDLDHFKNQHLNSLREKIKKSKKNVLRIKLSEGNYSHIKFYSGKTILMYLTMEVNKAINIKLWAISALILQFIRTFILLSIDFGKEKIGFIFIYSSGFPENFFLICLKIIMLYFYFVIALFSFFVVIDLGRKTQMMKHLTQLLSPVKINNQIKFLPTLNLLDITSVNTWRKMRIVAKEYGKKYFKRHELNLAVSLLNLGFVSLLFIMFQAVLFFDFIVSAVYIGLMLFFAASINSYYNIHKQHLGKVKEILKELQSFKNHFFDIDEENDPNFSLIDFEREEIFFKNIKNPIFRAFQRQLARICPKEHIGEYLELLIEEYDSIIESIEKEEEFDQLKVLGIKIDMAFFGEIVGASVTGAVAVTQFLFLGGED